MSILLSRGEWSRLAGYPLNACSNGDTIFKSRSLCFYRASGKLQLNKIIQDLRSESTEVGDLEAGKTTERLVEILESEGIAVSNHLCNDEERWSAVEFECDNDTAMRAAKLALESGYHPEELVGRWMIVPDGIAEPEWALLFREGIENGN